MQSKELIDYINTMPFAIMAFEGYYSLHNYLNFSDSNGKAAFIALPGNKLDMKKVLKVLNDSRICPKFRDQILLGKGNHFGDDFRIIGLKDLLIKAKRCYNASGITKEGYHRSVYILDNDEEKELNIISKQFKY